MGVIQAPLEESEEYIQYCSCHLPWPLYPQTHHSELIPVSPSEELLPLKAEDTALGSPFGQNLNSLRYTEHGYAVL